MQTPYDCVCHFHFCIKNRSNSKNENIEFKMIAFLNSIEFNFWGSLTVGEEPLTESGFKRHSPYNRGGSSRGTAPITEAGVQGGAIPLTGILPSPCKRIDNKNNKNA